MKKYFDTFLSRLVKFNLSCRMRTGQKTEEVEMDCLDSHQYRGRNSAVGKLIEELAAIAIIAIWAFFIL